MVGGPIGALAKMGSQWMGCVWVCSSYAFVFSLFDLMLAQEDSARPMGPYRVYIYLNNQARTPLWLQRVVLSCRVGAQDPENLAGEVHFDDPAVRPNRLPRLLSIPLWLPALQGQIILQLDVTMRGHPVKGGAIRVHLNIHSAPHKI